MVGTPSLCACRRECTVTDPGTSSRYFARTARPPQPRRGASREGRADAGYVPSASGMGEGTGKVLHEGRRYV